MQLRRFYKRKVLDQLLMVCGVTFLAMVSPGPDIAVVLRNTVVGGRATGLEPPAAS